VRGTKKQDKQGVRTPADIERKYDLGQDFSQIEKLATAANSTAMSAKRIADNAASDVAGLIPAVEKNTADIDEMRELGGVPGKDGATFTPSVDSDGNLSWTNDRGMENPATVNIKGAKGDKGDPGGISGGILTGILVAQNNTAYTTKQVRNIFFSTEEPTDADGDNGDIWIMYSE
jgi:hypothetical protein